MSRFAAKWDKKKKKLEFSEMLDLRITDKALLNLHLSLGL